MQDLITPDWMVAQGATETLAKRFWAKVEITDGCWLWKGAMLKSGYGRLYWNKQNDKSWYIFIRAHRLSWMLHFGPIQDGLCVCHNCPGGDNRRCVRPDHLWLGTRADNSRDMDPKGRRVCGERSHFHKISECDVREIRQLASAGKITNEAIGKVYGVTDVLISYIVNRKIWKHVS